ncbi:aspartate 1-decarboxylase [Actinomadura fulvescens]|uniref:Aspartate 1-decarboxylase n=1 Tax=Actinomadura fulvescens TaxID=46160 RepID=A0ABN3QXF2_9ACTN
MYRTMLKSKIHRATVTHANLHYVGSLTICRDLMRAADLLPGERVDIANINNGSRMSTYAIEGPSESRIIGVNGASARLFAPGDLVTILGYGICSGEEVEELLPRVVLVDPENRLISCGNDAAEPAPRSGTVRGDTGRP